MNYKYPHTIENCLGEKIVFQSVLSTPEGEKVMLDGFCQPGAGPAMHTHLMQQEQLTVVSGKMGYQTLGQAVRFANAGETVLFNKGVPHKFWADGSEVLQIKGIIEPAHNVVFFLSAVYAAQNKSGKGEPDPFDGAYLMIKYAKEYDMPEIPTFVKKVIFPITYQIGKLMGKYKHFANAPKPLQ